MPSSSVSTTASIKKKIESRLNSPRNLLEYSYDKWLPYVGEDVIPSDGTIEVNTMARAATKTITEASMETAAEFEEWLHAVSDAWVSPTHRSIASSRLTPDQAAVQGG
jgi:hypothetical protein